MRAFALITPLVFMGLQAFPAVAHACIWDTDTLRDEIQTKADVFDLISGQFRTMRPLTTKRG